MNINVDESLINSKMYNLLINHQFWGYRFYGVITEESQFFNFLIYTTQKYFTFLRNMIYDICILLITDQT